MEIRVFRETMGERLLVEWTGGGPERTPLRPFRLCNRDVVPEVQVHFSRPSINLTCILIRRLYG